MRAVTVTALIAFAAAAARGDVDLTELVAKVMPSVQTVLVYEDEGIRIKPNDAEELAERASNDGGRIRLCGTDHQVLA